MRRASDTVSSNKVYVTCQNVVFWATLFTKSQKNYFDLIPRESIISSGGFFHVWCFSSILFSFFFPLKMPPVAFSQKALAAGFHFGLSEVFIPFLYRLPLFVRYFLFWIFGAEFGWGFLFCFWFFCLVGWLFFLFGFFFTWFLVVWLVGCFCFVFFIIFVGFVQQVFLVGFALVFCLIFFCSVFFFPLFPVNQTLSHFLKHALQLFFSA